MEIPEDKKIEILLAVLKERYDSIHKIRDRVQSSGTWILGILLASSGWLLQVEREFSTLEKAVFILGTLAAFLVFNNVFLADLRKGFRAQQRAAVVTERALGLYEKKLFTREDISVYPDSWQSSGMENSDGKFFGTVRNLLLVGTIFLIGAILLSGVERDNHHEKHRGYTATCSKNRVNWR